MAVRNPPSFLQNITLVSAGHTAQNDRLTFGAAFTPGAAALSGRSGIVAAPAAGQAVVSMLSNVLVRVGAFRAVIQGTRSALQGQYEVINDGNVDLAVGAMAAGVSRKDLLIVNVRDTAFAPDTLDSAAIQVVPGTPAASNPAEPALGGVNLGNYLILGVLNVPPTGGTVTFTPRTDLVTVAVGGITPAAGTAAGVYVGQYRDHSTEGGLQRWDGTIWEPINGAAIRGKMWRTSSVGNTGATLTDYIVGMDASRVRGGFTFDDAGDALVIPVDGLYDLVWQIYLLGNAVSTGTMAVRRVRSAVANLNVAHKAFHKPLAASDLQEQGSSSGIPLKAGDRLQLSVLFQAGPVQFFGNSEHTGSLVAATYAGPLGGASPL